MRKPQTKVQFLTAPGAIVDNASLTTAVIDTVGAHLVEILVLIGASDAAMSALSVQESDEKADANTLSGGTGISDLVAGTSALTNGSASALPSATDDNKFFRFLVNTQGRKRYLDLTATGGDGTAGAYISAIAILHYLTTSPKTDAERGVAQTLQV